MSYDVLSGDITLILLLYDTPVQAFVINLTTDINCLLLSYDKHLPQLTSSQSSASKMLKMIRLMKNTTFD